MTTANTRARRIAALGGLVVAAAAVPALAALTDSSTSTSTATGTCLAWFGSRGDGQCLSYSNNNVSVGTPQFGVFGPDAGAMPGGGIGVTTGPLLPGQTISIPLG
ncbi:hypothetical protein ORI20_11840 [Mycobacterium sp. CVI_P3]|uniref:Uncharacterized protein n=1 Tax=Mycobacterium pinniadriaticum TaxID=2994102 RepID=A0ABT3SD12_9MYCO|nr:hypothetical protein [Mycobacterium pinniadriaticum]MCX2930971.1 hypothetical protein [Mycobacterium pinniadriaticum]MCX2937395.1 hypothetical protein [Mycobacterium pinniadriaticum]